MAKLHAVLANPLGCTGFAVVEVGHFLLLPLPGEAIGVYLQGNALNFEAFPCQNAHTLVERTHLPVDG